MSHLANNTFFESPIFIPLNEPENPKSIEVISFHVAPDGLEFMYYLEGQGRELFDKIPLDELHKWAVSNKEIFLVWELPIYDQSSDEEHIVIYPPTGEMGTADEINKNRMRRFLNTLTIDTVERFLKSRMKQP